MNVRKGILLLCTVLCILCKGQSIQAQELPQYKSYEGFEYSYSSSKDCIWIMKYIGNEENVIVPAYIEGKEVRYLCDIFQNNTTIKTVELPDTLMGIGSFSGCTSLEKIVIPKKIRIIPDYTFYGCKNLKHVQFFDGLLRIDDYSFAGCEALEEVVIPNTVTSIGKGAFSNCTKLQKVVLSKNMDLVYIRVFYNCTKLKTITLPKKINCISAEAFAGCKSLQKIKLSSVMTNIGEYAFSGCGIKEIVLPKKIEVIREGAFSDCKKLKKIVIKSKKIKEEYLGQLAFHNINKKAVFDVPNSCVSKYKKWFVKTGSFKKKTMKIK